MNQSARQTQPTAAAPARAASRWRPGWWPAQRGRAAWWRTAWWRTAWWRTGGRGPFGWVRWAPLALASALALLAAYPPLEWHALAWVALAPLALGLRHGAGGAGAWAAAGWLYGLGFWGAQLAWLQFAFVAQAGMGWLHFANFYGFVVAMVALGLALVLGLARWLWLRWRLTPFATLPVLLAAQDALLGVWPFGGLAWGSLAGPQAGTLAARAVVPLLGGAGLVLLLSGVNAGWAGWMGWVAGLSARPPARQLSARQPPARRLGGGAAGGVAGGAVLALLTALCLWPAPRVAGPDAAASHPTPRTLPVLLVPGDLSLAELQAGRDTPAPLRYYLGRTLDALGAPPGAPPAAPPGAPPAAPPAALQLAAARPALVLWPESALPGAAERGRQLPELAQVGALLGVDFLLGSNAWVGGRESNALYLLQSADSTFQRYDKRRLVPFGEYVPAGFRWLFPRKLTSGEDDYLAGTGAPVLDWRGERLGLAICFETMLPGAIRDAVRAGATVLVGAANDAWLTPAARRQHLQLTALRGLEVDRDVLFVANRGWSGLLRGGRALALSPREPLRVEAIPRTTRTPFVRWGAWPLAGVALLVLLAAWRVRRR